MKRTTRLASLQIPSQKLAERRRGGNARRDTSGLPLSPTLHMGEGVHNVTVENLPLFQNKLSFTTKNMDTSCVNRYKLDNNELDIFIPSKNIGIE